ncbi:hypothetical protein GCM10027187_40490 [Streptosporangium sandarakinum]
MGSRGGGGAEVPGGDGEVSQAGEIRGGHGHGVRGGHGRVLLHRVVGLCQVAEALSVSRTVTDATWRSLRPVESRSQA